ncbi:hypothetical protein PYW08_007429 [Mythimna loreyi]|uniref:Uncharacterized protein n=1 Tax=Mythimna loreyi TaxID=667449 RepID=A0ACC2QBU4_9NEOP|nr:hypothetical protein PYW08_007429 [Mythimna loreyi]
MMIDSRVFINEFLVIKNINQNLILGQDFFYKYKAVIDFANNCITLNNAFRINFCKYDERNVASMSHPMVHHDKTDGINTNDVMNGHDPREGGRLNYLSKNDYLYFAKLLREHDEEFVYNLSNKSNSIEELNINSELSQNEKNLLKNLLSSYRENFAFTASELGRCSLEEIIINTVDDIPVHHPPYRASPKQLDIINSQVEEMLKNGVIRESRSAYASPVVLVQKPDQTWRFCVDYRKLNKKVITDSYPLPIIEDIMIYLSGARYFADLDLNSGYWQHRICEKDKHKTAFITSSGLYEFNVLPFGLKTSQAVFQRTMDKVLAGIKYKKAICYVDNILVWGNNFTDFIDSLEDVMMRLKKANLTLKPSKCSFGYNTISVLGHEISGAGVKPDNKKLQSLKTLKTPTNAKQVKSILGLFSYYRKFISNFAEIVLPLTRLLRKGVAFKWTDKEEEAFQSIIKIMESPPILHFYSNDPNILTRLYVDASGEAVGCCLMQGREVMYPVSYASRKLSDGEKKYSTTEKECLALVWALNYFKHFLWGLKFQVMTDHKALCWLRSRRDMNGRLARWSLCIQAYDFDIVHCAGRDNVIADFLSRNPLGQEEKEQRSVAEPLEDGMQLYRIEVVRMRDEQGRDDFCRLWLDRIADNGGSDVKGFCVKGDVLCKKARRLNGVRDLVVVPKGLLHELLKELHDDPWSGGHLGLAKTLAKFRAKYFIRDAEREIERYVSSCKLCQERKKGIGLAQLQPVVVNDLMEKVGIDILGPFRKSLNGNRYIIVSLEYVTKYAVCKAVPRVTAQRISDFLIEDIFCRFGGVKEVISDRGSVFTSRLVKSTVSYFGAKSRFTTAFHPQTNGLVESFNKLLCQMLSMYVSADQRNWCSYVPLVCYAYNSSKQASTRVSPHMLLYAREPLFQTDMTIGIPHQNRLDYVGRHGLKCQLSRCAINNIKKAQARQKAIYDKKAKVIRFAPNQLVMVYTPRRFSHKSFKLCRLYRGPYQIVRRISDVNYVIKKLNNRRFRDIVHINRLKPFHVRL